MSLSDPMAFAARAAQMSDEELVFALRDVSAVDAARCLYQALLDESRLRGSPGPLDYGSDPAP